ncbi:MAG: ATP-binding protein [Winogradskyella sp.]|nr:ATP-binding protein [Winogradskyella sp.]
MTKKRYILKRTLAVLMLGLCLGPVLQAQSNKIAFKEYGVKEGLPEEVAFHFIEDDQGFIWIATQNGLVKFDGYDMQLFGLNHEQGKANSLEMRNLNGGILKDKTGKLWMGGVSLNSGLSFYDPKTRHFSNILYHPDSTQLPFPDVSLHLVDQKNDIWFSSYSRELDTAVLCRYDQRSHLISQYPQKANAWTFNEITGNGRIVSNTKDGSIWILDETSSSIKKFDAVTDSFLTKFKPRDTIDGKVLPFKFLSIGRSDDYLVVTANDGSYLIDILSEKIAKVVDFKTNSENGSASCFVDEKNLLWFRGGKYLTIYNLNTDERTELIFGEGALEQINSIGFIYPMLQTDTEIYFMNLKRGNLSVLKYDYETATFTIYNDRFNARENPKVLDWFPTRMKVDFSGTKWLGTRPNLYKEEVKKIKLLTHFGKEQIKIDSLNTPFEDGKKRLWVSFSGGVMLKDAADKEFQIFLNENNQFPFKDPIYFIEDHQNHIWVGSNNGFAKYDEFSKSFTPFQKGEEMNRIAYDSLRKHIWVLKENSIEAVALDGQKLYELDRDITKGFDATNFFQDSNGNVWFGDANDNDFGIIKLLPKDSIVQYNRIANDESSLSDNEIRYITEDRLGTIWIATDGGLNKYTNGKIERIRVGESFSGNWAIGKDNTLWLTTYSGTGLVNVNPVSNTTTDYGQDKGLLHNDVSTRNYGNNGQLAFDAQGRLYLTTQRGLSVFDPKTKTFLNFKEEDGLQLGSRDTRTITLSNGEVWILGDEGINSINPKVLFEEKNSIPPKVWITNMTIMDSTYSAPDGEIFTEAIDFTDEIKVAYWQKDLTFEFVALHYLRPENNQYSWILEGYDEQWTKPSLDRTASYTNLSPGTYTFKVKASNADGVWNEEGASIEVIILPPWWQTWWAYGLYALILGFIGYRLHLIQKQKTIEKERLRNQEKQLEQAKEIEKAYTELKATQSQLVQSEKMASLGELTAGIAHEIQNPLNFVNNFAEVSNELIDEMIEELDRNEIEEAKAISADIKQNLEKINYHGKRADGIVKGMLQHSRNNSGKKELTDINKLTDEYFRLAYHGLRAKDKTFNATLETHFDESLPKVNIVSQDIGRVILNLFTNAFYACNDRNKTSALEKTQSTENKVNTYEPMVTVTTRAIENAVEILVRDNGSGIPQNVIDKIFEPFYTTKPTGQGTGLGLSMSYDIIKAHKGELTVQTELGAFTEFKIILPTKN